jgi:hypothetical protein
VGGDFYNGIEWLACWLLDNVEGETITEEQLRPWAVEAWREHLKRQNDQHQRWEPAATDAGVESELNGWLPSAECCGVRLTWA